MAESFDAAVSRIAKDQQRNITRRQLRSIGLAPTAIRHRVMTGRLHRTRFPGVYAVGTPAITPHERAYGAILACGPNAILSHASAMVLNGIWQRWEGPLEVTITKGDRRPKGIRVHRSRTMHEDDLKEQYGIPVTSPARTLYDIERRFTDDKLLRTMNRALHDKILRSDPLEELLERLPNERLAYFIDAPPSDSKPEDEFLPFCDAHDIPRPLMHQRLGPYTVDAYWPQAAVIAELDGWNFHNTELDFETDRERDAYNLTAGRATIRITRRRMLREPAKVARQLKAILANRRPGASSRPEPSVPVRP
jgi:hypothetical protein